MTNTDRAAYFGTLAVNAIRKGLPVLAVGYAKMAAHWAGIYLTNRDVCRAS